MRKFTFTLHALLHLRQSVEKQERNNLAVITRKMHQLEDERDAMLLRRDEASEVYKAKLQEGIPVSDTKQFTDYFRMMKDLLEEQARKILEAQQELEDCRRRLVEVMREIRTLEKLREKQYTEYMQEVQSEEERMIGDFVSYQTGQNPQDNFRP
jgi:flagellar FliJ protein